VVIGSYFYTATIVLVIELIVLGLLGYGYTLKRKNKYQEHGITMTSAVVLHLVTIFTWMVQSFASFFSFVPVDLSSVLHWVIYLHVAFGTIAAGIGVWLVAAWHLQKNVQKCFTRKRIMLATITLWIAAILLGLVLYMAVLFS
jgi:hypothetical protein